MKSICEFVILILNKNKEDNIK